MTTVTPPVAPKTISLVQADGTPITITPGLGPEGGVLGGGGDGGGGGPPPILPPQAPSVTDNSNSSSNNDTTIVAFDSGAATIKTSTTTGTPCTSSSSATVTSRTSSSKRGSFFSEGREFYDDGYSVQSEDSVLDRFDFSSIQARGVQDLQNIQILHDVYSHVQHHSNHISHPKNTAPVAGTGIGAEDSRKQSFATPRTHREKKQQQDPATATPATSTSSVVMLKGVSGTGKNTLVNKFIQELEEQSKLHDGPKKPYFMTGKCDELSVGDPYSAIVEALNGFVTTITRDESSMELERIQAAIHDAVGYEAAQSLITIIPNLEHLIVKKPILTTDTPTTSNSRKGGHHHPEDKDLNKANVNSEEDHDEDDEEIRPVVSGSKENAWNRLKYLFQVFTNAVSTKERPVIMFLDDLQWCDSASLELLEALLSDPDLEYLMFIGAYRDDELVVQPEPVPTGKNQPEQEQEHILQTTMKSIETNTGRALQMIHLVNMTYNELYGFVSKALLPKQEHDDSITTTTTTTTTDPLFDEKVKDMKPLVDVIYRKTSGNIFFTVQVMEELQRKGILSFSRMTFEWEWNLENIEKLDDLLSDDVLEAVSSKLSSAPKLLQQALILAAYTRSTVDIDTLQQLLELENVTSTIPSSNTTTTTSTTSIASRQELLKVLDEAVADGLLYNSMGSNSYSFAHDHVQQAAYAMVPTGRERDVFRMKMGLRLYELGQKKTASTTTKSSGKSRSGGGEDWMLFVAADHLNAVSYQVQATMGSMFLTKLNLEVGQRAASVAAYETASAFLGLAIQCLLKGVKDPWMTEYETTLQIYRSIVDAELYQGHLEIGSGIGERIFKHAKTADDKLPTQISLGRALGRDRKHREAFDLSIKALRVIREYPKGFVGVNLGLAKDLLYVKKYFKKNSNRNILRLPSMTDPRLLQAMELLNIAGYQAFYIGKTMEYLAITLRMLRLTFKHGLCGQSGNGMMGWALVLDGLKDAEGSSRISRLARDTLRVTKAKELECINLFVAGYFINAWKDPPDEVSELYHLSHKSGMESGDFENGHLSLMASCYHEYLAGYSLSLLDAKYAGLMEKLDLYKVDSVKVLAIEQRLELQQLRGTAEAPLDFEALQSSFGSEKNDGSEMYQIMYQCMSRIKFGVYFGNCEFAETYIQKITPLVKLDTAHTPNCVRLFFGSIIYSTLARENKKQRQSYRKQAKKYADELKALCNVKGKNSYHRYLLADAHFRAGSAESGNSAQTLYDRAIDAAWMSEHGHDAALGSQLAAEHFLVNRNEVRHNVVLARSREILVRQYLKQARDWYLQWGARGLVRHLEQIYNEYLDPTPESVPEEPSDVDGFSCAHTFNSMELGSYSKPSGDEVSVMTDLESVWGKASTFTSPALLDALDEIDG